MWIRLAHVVIKYRIAMMVIVGLMTVFMGYHARQVQMSYDFMKVVPDDDEDMVFFRQFKERFGEDGNIFVIGMRDSTIYELENFTRLKYLSDEIAKVRGVQTVLSLPRLQRLIKNQEEKKFDVVPLFPEAPKDQHQLDTLLTLGAGYQLYQSQLVNTETGATLIVVSLASDYINSEKRQQLLDDVMHLSQSFEEATGVELHYAGLPYVRTAIGEKVKSELQMFLIMSLFITAAILMFYFRSWRGVVFPLIIILIVVVWVMGTIDLLGYKITILTGLIPPIIVVIGIPNSIYLLSRFHLEFSRHGNKIKALTRVVQKVGLVTFITNLTTAIGFLVLTTTGIQLLIEFGVVAGINVFATFLVSIILIPAVFASLPDPNAKQLKHLDFKGVLGFVKWIDKSVHVGRPWIYAITTVIVIAAIVGVYRIVAVSYMVDDLPEESTIKQDLAFFERNFSGVMPLDIVVDFGKPNGVMNPTNLKKVEELENYLVSLPEVASPISLVGFVKTARFAFYNENEAFHGLPTNRERSFILPYLKGTTEGLGLTSSFMDSTGQQMRISLQIADMGSIKMKALLDEQIRPKMDSIFQGTDIEAEVTGSTLIFIKGNKYLIQNLQTSFLIAIGVVALVMALLFGSFKMVLISLVPNIIPLLITGGIMGYFGIPLKPSTALIFSIAFGISVDDSIHFLAKYRQELFNNQHFVPRAVTISLQETGPSMFFTSIVLFGGFIIFAFSEFGGTIALGILTSATLMVAMLSNLILLPSLLINFDSGKRKRQVTFEPLIDEFYDEHEDEEIDIERIEIPEKGKYDREGKEL